MLPARAESIKKIHIVSCDEELLIPNQEIENGIYIANTIVKTKSPYVRIINTTDKDVFIRSKEVKT